MTEVEYLRWINRFISYYLEEIEDYHKQRYPDNLAVDDILKRVGSEKWVEGNWNMGTEVQLVIEERLALLEGTPSPYKLAGMQANLHKLLRERYGKD